MKKQNIYTASERTDKKYTVLKAIESAARRYPFALCLDAVKGMSRDKKITLEELNEIADEIVSDSEYFNC